MSTRLGIRALTVLRRSELFATLPGDVVYSFGQVAVKVFRFRFAVAESEGRATRNAKVPCLPRSEAAIQCLTLVDLSPDDSPGARNLEKALPSKHCPISRYRV